MSTHASANNEQARLWNGPAGHAWVDKQALLDEMLAPFQELLVEAVRVAGAGRVLDVGCGPGSTTIAIAKQLGDGGSCTGVDISGPLVAAAKARASSLNATFVLADAQTHRFQPPAYDMVVSRFGVMFFDDPACAFANIADACEATAKLAFITWQAPVENPFMTAAEQAARPFLPDLPAREPDAPGQFGMADPDKVRRMLELGNWCEIALQPLNIDCHFAQAHLAQYVTTMGPVGVLLQNADDATRKTVIKAVMEAFNPFVHGDLVRLKAACWYITARKR